MKATFETYPLALTPFALRAWPRTRLCREEAAAAPAPVSGAGHHLLSCCSAAPKVDPSPRLPGRAESAQGMGDA